MSLVEIQNQYRRLVKKASKLESIYEQKCVAYEEAYSDKIAAKEALESLYSSIHSFINEVLGDETSKLHVAYSIEDNIPLDGVESHNEPNPRSKIIDFNREKT